MEKDKLNIRKVKCITKCAEKGERYLHPITLGFNFSNKSKSCGTKYNLIENKNVYEKKCESNESIANNELVKFMALPYLNLSPEQLIKIYDVEDIEKLIKWIDESVKKNYYYNSINRILNTWIRLNYLELLKNNNFLEDIYFKIYKSYWKDIKSLDKDIKLSISKYINSWFQKKNFRQFKLNLGNDLKNFLSNKYGK